jgi:ATP-binding cassette subfamily F protein uup
LILDEPTNDLDIETLELLEAELVAFDGTLIIVSHDRRFLNNVVTSTLVFEGDGRIEEYMGGFEDWQRARLAASRVEAASAVPAREPRRTTAAATPTPQPAPTPAVKKKKLSHRERGEFDSLPARIEALEDEDTRLQSTVASAEFYKEGAAAIEATLARMAAVRAELDAAYRRWDELDSRPR